MNRHVLAIALAACLTPAYVTGQTAVLTINAPKAEVRTSPSIASPVVAEAPRGSVLEVTREVGRNRQHGQPRLDKSRLTTRLPVAHFTGRARAPS